MEQAMVETSKTFASCHTTRKGGGRDGLVHIAIALH